MKNHGLQCFFATLIILLTTSGVAIGQNFEELSRLLTPAYTAMSLANLCSTEPGWPFTQPRGQRGVAVNYAEHVKDEIVASLSDQDAFAVLKPAADAARNEARAQLREKVIVSDKTVEAIRFRDWCNGYVNDFIEDVIRKHDGDHAAFLRRVDLAKSPYGKTQ